MLRVQSNQERLIHHDLRNVYIRLAKKDDASGDPYFWLNLSGYELDDYRITRMTKAEYALRVMGMQLACHLGVNFFDWKDESVSDEFFYSSITIKPSYSKNTYICGDNHFLKLFQEEHLVFHYKTYSRIHPLFKMQQSSEDQTNPQGQAPPGTFLSVPAPKKPGMLPINTTAEVGSRPVSPGPKKSVVFGHNNA